MQRCTALEGAGSIELDLELIQTQMAQKPMLRPEVGMRVRCANIPSVANTPRSPMKPPRNIHFLEGLGTKTYTEVKVCLSARKAPVILPLSLADH